jgi:hypothetical protein
MASLAIKISTTKAIETLEARVKLAEAANKEYAASKKAHDAAIKKHNADTLKLIIKNGTPRELSRRWYGNGTYEVTFDMNEGVVLPEKPSAPEWPTNILADSTLNELKQTIRILKMTDEPTVNANIMKKFADYL